MRSSHVAIIGAGIGGLVAALELARAGFAVTLLERQPHPGGKMREVETAGRQIDAGPTVFTMRWVFDRIFSDAGTTLADHLTLKPLERLARHAWSDSERLDLFADVERSADAIGKFAGAAEAQGFRDFCRRARNVYATLEEPFIRSAQPTAVSLALGAGLKGLGDLWWISPFTTLSRALEDHFRDSRLRQLFGRYATYCGSSPYLAPATLMLVAHVEQEGVWVIEGGLYRLAQVLSDLAIKAGATVRYGADVAEVLTSGGKATGVRLATGEQISADAVVVNADSAAVADGLLGRNITSAVSRLPKSQRSLSAMTWAMTAATDGFPLVRHNVFFSRNYAAEFDDIFQRSRVPTEPTVYVCAQDRGDDGLISDTGPERLLVLINAPANGDSHTFPEAEIASCAERTFAQLARSGLRINRAAGAPVVTTPEIFNRLFPATGGALYGGASHGWAASFSRPSARSRIPGLYLAGGSVHPGPGVPMAALSGWLAAAHIVADQTSSSRSIVMGMPGGTSMR
jgi:1-hydroxycarotenoid 3,4-desaturase